MSNAHVNHHIAVALGPYMPRRTESDYRSRAVLPKHRVFAVKVTLGKDQHEMNILARSSIAAITQAIGLLAIDDNCPAEGIAIDCKPAAKVAP